MNEYLIFDPDDGTLCAQCWASSPAAAVRRSIEADPKHWMRWCDALLVFRYVDADPADGGVHEGTVMPDPALGILVGSAEWSTDS